MRHRLLAAVTAAAFLSAAASADTLYQNGSHVVAGDNSFATGQIVADDFTLDSKSVLNGFGFIAFTGDLTNVPKNVTLSIYTNEGTGPTGTPLFSITTDAVEIGRGGDPLSNLNRVVYGLEGFNWTLDAGKYYVALSTLQGDLYWSDVDDTGADNKGDNWFLDPRNSEFRPKPSDNGFFFTGDRIAATPAPEPVSWALMLGGFGLVGGVLRRKRKIALVRI